MKKFISPILIAMLVVFATSCRSKTPKAGGTAQETEQTATKGEQQITLSGAFALYPLAVIWADEFKKLHPEVKIDISAGGAGKGMTDVLAKVVDLGMVSREIYPQETEKGALGFAVAKDAVVPTINAENPMIKDILAKGLKRDAAVKLWIDETYKTWGDVTGTPGNTPVHVYTRSDACGAAETWALWMGAKQEDLGGTAVFGDPGVAAAIQKDKLGIGLNNIGYAYDEKTRKPNTGLLVMPIDVNNDGQITPDENFYATKDELIKAIADGKYPSPPARDLYLVTNGVPDKPIVAEFIKYILTDGQKHNIPAGYIPMSEEKVELNLAKLNK